MESFNYVCTYAEALVLKAYGLRDLPTAFYPDDKTDGVTLSCYKMHESDSFSNFDDPVMAVNYLVNVTKLIPVHVIFGQKSLFRYALAYYPISLILLIFWDVGRQKKTFRDCGRVRNRGSRLSTIFLELDTW